jgi:hypothetical protein
MEEKRLKAEFLRVSAARAEMEYIIAQRQEEINRLEEHIKIQIAKEQELSIKLKELQK